VGKVTCAVSNVHVQDLCEEGEISNNSGKDDHLQAVQHRAVSDIYLATKQDQQSPACFHESIRFRNKKSP